MDSYNTLVLAGYLCKLWPELQHISVSYKIVDEVASCCSRGEQNT